MLLTLKKYRDFFLGNCGNTTIQSKLRTEMQQIEKYPDRADLNNLLIMKILTKISLSHHRGEEKVGALPRTRKSLSALHEENPVLIGTRCEHQMQVLRLELPSHKKVRPSSQQEYATS